MRSYIDEYELPFRTPLLCLILSQISSIMLRLLATFVVQGLGRLGRLPDTV